MPFIIADPNGTLLVPTIFMTQCQAQYKIDEILEDIKNIFLESVLRNELMNNVVNNHRIKEIVLAEKFNGII